MVWKGKSDGERADAYQRVTDAIIAQLEAGTVPWRQPWVRSGWPLSMADGHRYRGVNALLLFSAAHSSPFWGTYDQIAQQSGFTKVDRTGGRGGTYWARIDPGTGEVDHDARVLKENQKGSLITFYRDRKMADPSGEIDPDTGRVKLITYPAIGVWHVFNADQCGPYLPAKFAAREHEGPETDADAESAIGAYLATGKAAQLVHDEHGRAYYHPATDTIHLPPASEHTGAAEYYSTLLHELGHSTGHPSRLNRDGIRELDHFGSDRYGKEELVAELTAAFSGAELGVRTAESETNNAAYLASWLRAIKSDKKMIVQAASKAQAAADLILEPSRQAVADEPEREPEPAEIEAAA